MLSHHVIGREVAVSRLCCQPAGDSSADSDNNVVRGSLTFLHLLTLVEIVASRTQQNWFQTLYKMVMLAQLDKELVVKVAVEAGACPKCALRYHVGFS